MKNILYASILSLCAFDALNASYALPQVLDESYEKEAMVRSSSLPYGDGREAKIIDETHESYQRPSAQRKFQLKTIRVPVMNLGDMHKFDSIEHDFPDAVQEGYFSFRSYKAFPQQLAFGMIRSLTNPDDAVEIKTKQGDVTFHYKGFKNLPSTPLARFFTNMKVSNPFRLQKEDQESFELILYTVGSGGMRKTEFENARIMCEKSQKNRVIVVIDPYETNIGSKQFDASAPTPMLNVYSFLNGIHHQGQLLYNISSIHWVSSSVSGMSSMGLGGVSMPLYKMLRKNTFTHLPKLYPINEIHALHMPAVLQLHDDDLVATGAKLVFYVGKNDAWIKQDATLRYILRLKNLGHDVSAVLFEGGHDFETLDYELIESRYGHRMDEICTVLLHPLKNIARMSLPRDAHKSAQWMRRTPIAKIIGQKADDGTHPEFSIFDWMILLQMRTLQGVKASAHPLERDRLIQHLINIGNPHTM